MKPYEQIAVAFATALVQERWQDARGLLSRSLQNQYSLDRLKETTNGMFGGYAEGPAKRIRFDPMFSMQDWPAKKVGDVGWAYVGIEGDDFVEAVTVVVADVESRLVIREIEWGRP